MTQDAIQMIDMGRRRCGGLPRRCALDLAGVGQLICGYDRRGMQYGVGSGDRGPRPASEVTYTVGTISIC